MKNEISHSPTSYARVIHIALGIVAVALIAFPFIPVQRPGGESRSELRLAL